MRSTVRKAAGVGILGGVVGGIIYLLGRGRHRASSMPELPPEFRRPDGPAMPPEPVEVEPPRVATARGGRR